MTRALIVVDVQNDFCEGGSLAVAGGAQVASDVAAYIHDRSDADAYAHIVATKDWHIDPGSHWSDAPNSVTTWPVHCRAETSGSDFHANLQPVVDAFDEVFRKGEYEAAYSGFEGHATSDSSTGLTEWLTDQGVDEVDVVGIATDHCVRATALDAAEAGFDTRVLLSMTAGVAGETTEAALRELSEAGVTLVGSPKVASR